MVAWGAAGTRPEAADQGIVATAVGLLVDPVPIPPNGERIPVITPREQTVDGLRRTDLPGQSSAAHA